MLNEMLERIRPKLVPRCCECRYAGPREGFDSYTCRKNAPIAVHDPNKHCGVYQDAFVPRWPFMRGGDWCGDFVRSNAVLTGAASEPTGNGAPSHRVRLKT